MPDSQGRFKGISIPRLWPGHVTQCRVDHEYFIKLTKERKGKVASDGLVAVHGPRFECRQCGYTWPV